MAQRVGGYARGGKNFFSGTLQQLNGKTACYGELSNVGFDPRYFLYRRISTSLPNGGSKTVSRVIPKCTGIQSSGDLTKITTVQNAKVGGKNVQTVNKEFYKYGDEVLNVNKIQVDTFSGGKRRIESNSNYTYKYFYDAKGNLLKSVSYDGKSGLRVYATLPDGRLIRYNDKGLPEFTDRASTNFMDLGGLDKLI